MFKFFAIVGLLIVQPATSFANSGDDVWTGDYSKACGNNICYLSVTGGEEDLVSISFLVQKNDTKQTVRCRFDGKFRRAAVFVLESDMTGGGTIAVFAAPGQQMHVTGIPKKVCKLNINGDYSLYGDM